MKNGGKNKFPKKELEKKETLQEENTKTSKDFNILIEIREDMVLGNMNRML